MRARSTLLIVPMLMLGGAAACLAGDLQDQIRVEVQTAELQHDMKPGTYICDAGHLHIKGTVQNLADVPVGQVKVAGKVFDADGKLLGTATASTKPPTLRPNDKADVNLEFLTVTGPLVKQVKNRELSVVAVGPSP